MSEEEVIAEGGLLHKSLHTMRLMSDALVNEEGGLSMMFKQLAKSIDLQVDKSNEQSESIHTSTVVIEGLTEDTYTLGGSLVHFQQQLRGYDHLLETTLNKVADIFISEDSFLRTLITDMQNFSMRFANLLG